MNAPAITLLALLGPRGAGKTTLGRVLAARLGWDFADGDDLLAARAGMAAGEYLRRAGEPAFRALEEEVTVPALAPGARRVVALGGGAVLSAKVRAALARPHVLAVHLSAQAEVLAERLRASAELRPALTGLPPADEVRALLAARRSLYENLTPHFVDTGTRDVDPCCEAILAIIRPVV